MKTLKLEVGKTYRSRGGEEVRIVGKGRSGKFPYKSNNGRWYAENGRFTYYAGETPYDLIEEVPSESTRHTFKVPDGVKEITLDYFGNRIVVEMVPEDVEPKPGDVLVNEKDSVYILKEVEGYDMHRVHAWLGSDGRVAYDGVANPGRPATPEESQPLFDALKKAGKRWNAEAMQVEEIDEFYCILEWVDTNIKDGYYNQEVIAEAIEAYLKYREGEK